MLMACCSRDPAPAPAMCEAPAGDVPRLTVHAVGDAERAAVEDFIRRVYAERFGAQVQAFAPTLVCLRDASGIVAAAGYRPAAGSPLFLERYLAAPIEALLESQAGLRPERASIVEVGHLAAVRAGEGRRLIALLGPHLAEQGFSWVVSTLTQELRRLFLRLGVTPLALGVADPVLLGSDAVHWGRYYDHRPVVLAGQLQQALRSLHDRARAAGRQR